MDEQIKMKNEELFEEFCEKIEKIRGAEVYEACDEEEGPYVELAIMTDDKINKAKKLIEKFGYVITEEGECEGSDYPSYCIWFNDKED